DVEEIPLTDIKKDLEAVINQIKNLLSTYKKGKLVTEGIKLAIAGRPNVGKSSLFNALIGYERAIVSEIKGTTRDFIEESFNIHGIPVKLIDTAGIREAGDKIEKIGIEKTKEKIKEADIVLFVFDAYEGLTEEDFKIYEDIKHKSPIIVANKSDLLLDKYEKKYYFKDIIFTSTKTQEGIQELENKILNTLGLTEDTDSEVYINIRHQTVLEKSLKLLEKIYNNLKNYENFKEILMLEIREVKELLGEIIGEITTEDILGNIFSSFCIGK
ncbi:GTPase, partial [Hydrogenivirga sp. 128-5-R1-1]|uniref:tRNA modification GTPase n=1 Tax=Hydrogenivirga sp. 128-5-R1-1 TaxID=392423 RepID=UPI00015EEF47